MSELPFELKFAEPKEGITFCGVQIPKYGSLTPNEAIALSKVRYDKEKPDAFYFASVGNILLRSRTDLREYTAEELMDVPSHALNELFNFTLSEAHQWKEPEEEPEASEGESQTGETFIGESGLDTPTSNGLAESALVIVQS